MEQRNKKQAPMHRGPMGRGMPAGDKAKNFKKSFARRAKSFSVFKWMIFISLAFAIASSAINIGAPSVIESLTKVIFKAVNSGAAIKMARVAYFGIILICMYVGSSILNFLQSFIMAKVTAVITKKYREDISKKINRLPLKYFDNSSIGDVLSRVTNDVDTLGQSLSNSLSSVISSVTMILGSVIMMFVKGWLMTLVVLAIMPISLGLIMIIVKFSQKHFVKQQDELGNINGQIEEIYSAHNVVKVFTGEQKEQEKFEETNKKLFKSAVKANVLSGFMHPIMNFMGNLAYIVICILGGYIAYRKGDFLYAATIVAFIMYMRTFNNQIGNIANISSTLQSTAAASERLFEFLDAEEQEEEHKDRQLQTVKGNVEFKNVCFGYDADKVIIHNFSANIKAGQKVAIVGPTGAGKTTLVNLLMRFYEVNSGDILIDGVSIKDMPREEVRGYFGMVLQDAWLFEGTIRENISYGTYGLTNEQIETACSFAHIDHFIRSLPNGYDMVIDEKANISQGQRQLLTIARVMVNNAPMLILDEATSSVDTRTEELIQKAMDKVSEGRTSFVIAHRLSTIKNADIILVLKDGDIVESGNHEQLLEKGGFYADLYNSQFQEA